jgi:hypothetical protein
VFALGIAVFFGAIAFANWWTTRDELRAGSKVIHGEPIRVTHVPTTYRGVFRVENRAGKKLTVTTEKVWFRRPFASRVETWKGGEQLSVRHSAFGVLTSESGGSSTPLNIAVPPSLASGDIRVDAIIEDAVESKAFLRREQREVYGRECQVYRAGGPVFAGDVTRYQPGRGDYADFCVDRNGIVIEEYWVDKGELIRRRAATELDIDPSIDSDVFSITAEENPDIKRGAVERIKSEPSGEGIPLWTLPKTPKGYERLGRYAVVITPDAIPQTSQLVQTAGPSSTSDVYVRGPDVVVVDQDPSLVSFTSADKRPSKDLEIDGLSEAKLIIDGRMSEVRAKIAGGSIVRVFGTVEPKELIRLAKKLRPED